MKPPCRLAHASMASSRSGRGARRSSTARTRPATQISMNGKASTCGRARRCGAVMTTAATVNRSGRQRTKIAQQQAHHQREGEADRGGAEHRHRAPAAGIVGKRQQDLRQPLLGDPGLAGEGEGKAVDRRHRAVRQDPVADRDVPVAVGVGQQSPLNWAARRTGRDPAPAARTAPRPNAGRCRTALSRASVAIERPEVTAMSSSEITERNQYNALIYNIF